MPVDKEFKWKKDKWADIEDLIQRWKRRNPEDFQSNMEYVKEMKESLKDPKYAEWTVEDWESGGPKVGSGTGTRLGLAIHPGLLQYIETFYPGFMGSNDDVREFGKRFKAFQIPEKI